MPADINRRLNRILVGLSQNEALMEDLETEAASALLDWAGTCARIIVYETIEMDDEEAVDQLIYPRLRALRQMMRQTNLLASGRSADLEPASTTLDRIIAQAAILYGQQFALPTPESRANFLGTSPANSTEWIASLRAWLENNPPTPNSSEETHA